MALILAHLASACGAAADALSEARQLYQQTRYEEALAVLSKAGQQGAEADALAGQCYYMRGEFKRASEYFERAAAAEPHNSDYHLWLGRAYGRRAENSSFVTAPSYARKARRSFEKAFELDPNSTAAAGDLFDYYLEAPGMLGGGLDKARALAEKAKGQDEAEYHFRLARIAEKQKDWAQAEAEYRRALALAPQQAGRAVDLARFLSERGRFEESDAMFRKAQEIAPGAPKVWFEQAKTYIKARRNLDVARQLLERYLKAPLTPDDPPRAEAEELLKQARGG